MFHKHFSNEFIIHKTTYDVGASSALRPELPLFTVTTNPLLMSLPPGMGLFPADDPMLLVGGESNLPVTFFFSFTLLPLSSFTAVLALAFSADVFSAAAFWWKSSSLIKVLHFAFN
jgi:hypothetical protein